MRLARVAREIGQQRLGFLALDRHGVTGSSLEVEAAEQTQLQSRHLAENTSLFSARYPQGTPTGTCGTTPRKRLARVHVSHSSQPVVGQKLPTSRRSTTGR